MLVLMFSMDVGLSSNLLFYLARVNYRHAYLTHACHAVRSGHRVLAQPWRPGGRRRGEARPRAALRQRRTGEVRPARRAGEVRPACGSAPPIRGEFRGPRGTPPPAVSPAVGEKANGVWQPSVHSDAF